MRDCRSQDVSRLLKQHKNLAKTMKQMAKAGGMQRLLGAMRAAGRRRFEAGAEGPIFRGLTGARGVTPGLANQ